MERAQWRPGQGASAGFAYGKAIGAVEAIVQCCALQLYFIEPVFWKRHHGLLHTEKDASLERARQIFWQGNTPPFPLKKHHNRAESALIALAGEAKMGVLYTSN